MLRVRDLPRPTKTKLFQGVNPILEIKVTMNNMKRDKGFKREEILSVVQEYSNKLSDKGFNGKVGVSLFYPEGWNVGSDINLYSKETRDSLANEEDPKRHDRFAIYIQKFGESRGGCDDDQNDCLFDCLNEVVPDLMIKEYKNPSLFKSKLGLKRDDTVPLEKLLQIENALGKGLKIIVTGDHQYKSDKSSKLEIRLRLGDEHFTLEKKSRLKGVSFKERTPLVINYLDDRIETYNGKKYQDMSYEQIRDFQESDGKAAYKLFLELNPTLYAYRIMYDESQWLLKTNLFRFNNNNIYTHEDINTLKELGYQIQMIEDGNSNSLIYPTETRIDGPIVFKTFVEMLYNLKSKGIEEAKSPLNSLWGYMCKKNKLTIHTSSQKDYGDLSVYDLLSIRASDNENLTLKLIHSQEPFETPFARIQPFIVSHARKIMFNLLKDHINNIVWIHTDGFISNKMIEFKKSTAKSGGEIGNIGYGTNLGELQYKGCNKNL
eukprot:gene7982-9820_t